MDQSIINFKVYEDSVEYVGMAQATLPDLTALTQSSPAPALPAMSSRSFSATSTR